MNAIQIPPSPPYKNVMEVLVAEEVDCQLCQLPQRMAKYISRMEVETYALNRLPSLYASSEAGWRYQCQKGQVEFQRQIKNAVRQAFAAVQLDPIRRSQPLMVEMDQESQIAALQTLRELLHQPNLSWQEIIYQVSQTLGQSLHPDHLKKAKPIRRPGTYGKTTWRPKYR